MRRRTHTSGATAAAAAALLVVGCAGEPPAPNDPFSATGELIALSGGAGGAANACFTCHGLDGAGDGASVPRLAGLEAGYLLKQMEDYATGRRRDPVMRRVARPLGDQERRAVAEHYAALPAPARPPGATPPAATAAAAARLYHQGDPARRLVACADCHGARGEGGGAANPALAGQPADYAAEQLRRFADGERRNDPRGVMWALARELDAAERAALAAYLAAAPAGASASSPDSSGGSTPGTMAASTSS